MNHLRKVGLSRIDLPGRTVYLSEGGAITWGAQVYLPVDEVLGTIAAIDALEEGIGNQVPAMEVTFLPHPDATPSDLAQPSWQRARARFWLADYVEATGAVTGTPTILFDGFFDQVLLRVGRERRALEVSVVSWLELLFALNRGNGLSPSHHKSVWSGETGHDQASGLPLPVAWGVEAPPQPVRGASTATGFAGYRTEAWGAF